MFMFKSIDFWCCPLFSEHLIFERVAATEKKLKAYESLSTNEK